MAQTRITQEIEVDTDDSQQTGLLNCPVEILIGIFECYLAEKLNRLDRLALVCKLWDNIVMDTPTLWTHIVIGITTIRSGPQWHKITLNLNAEDFLPLFDTLYAEFHRWRSLYIVLPQTLNLSHIVFRYLCGCPSKLVELGLQDFSWRMNQTTSFTDLPSLKMLVLGSAFAYKEMVHSFSLASLQALDIDLHGFEMWNGGKDTRSDAPVLEARHTTRNLSKHR
ncbi:hypothetical protein M408DRAFT_8021 [Serendipita vermifera MAFF 305830]|uniref:F-box domain-containing protein n=1 Tax=Serendipita vermifera MAFF 305830 TaxID=933852 RepID=A0A0C3AZ10_SERVB|nr:hypothetical protein M408DRAFT_8021 [Serendipita vermifera MAFF 305830]